MKRMLAACLLGAGLPLFSGCISLPGKPPAGPEVPRPDSVHSATVLFAQNCSGCHGAKGMDGPAVPLAAPEYQALVDDARIRNVIANGDPGTLMPGFGKKSQGFLTDSQIDALVKGIRAEWYKGNVLAGLNAPPYADDTPGDAAHGLQVYSKVCSQCHGEIGGEVGYAGSILNASFLALMPAQSLRTAIIVGRPDLGMPDWRALEPGQTAHRGRCARCRGAARVQASSAAGATVCALCGARWIGGVCTQAARSAAEEQGRTAMSDPVPGLPANEQPSVFEHAEELNVGGQQAVSRRSFLFKFSIALNAAVAALIATPVIGYLLGPIRGKGDYNSWIPLGKVNDFQPGQTTLATYVNPYSHPWDGLTANTACYVRRAEGKKFTVFAVNCAHLGCPVRWFPQSDLFLCPCHGGVYYADGSRAAGPPERGLFTYPYRVDGDTLMIHAGQTPTLSNEAKLVKGITPCPGTNKPTIG